MMINVFPDGRLAFEGHEFRCALGRGGVRTDKREGDGATPVGTYALRRLHFRADRLKRPLTGLPVRAITPVDGWCDAPEDPAYNRLVALPFAASHELMWRDDALYDLVIEIGHNDNPPVPGAGSAVFIHIAKPDYLPTEGCIALVQEDLLALLARCATTTQITIGLD